MSFQHLPSFFFLARRITALLCLIAVLGALSAARAAEQKVTLNFVNADIDSVVRAIAEITGKTFVIDPRVKGTVNVISTRPVPQSLAYSFLLSALRIQGFAAVENNGVVTIVPEADAKTHAGPSSQGLHTGPRGNQMVTKVIPLRHESAAQMVPILRPLIAPNNPINANAGTNSLVITDYAENLVRLEKIIEALDTPQGNEPVVVPLRHASAIDLAATLDRVFAAGPVQPVAAVPGAAIANGGQRLNVVVDSRSNSLILTSHNPDKLTRARNLIQALDQPTAGGNIHVVYLKNAEAERVARTLRGIVSGEVAAPSEPAPLTPAPGDNGATMATGAASARPGVAAVETGSAGFIQADPDSNAVIITAPEAVYNNLRGVIDMLDKRRAQVYVEALVVELTSDRASEFGIQWQDISGTANGGLQVVGGTNFGAGGQNIIGLIENIANARNTGTLGIAPGLNLGIIAGGSRTKLPGLGLLARVLESHANANILSAPNLLTLDNEEARIVVGSNVPFITGQYAQTGAAATPTPFQTYERRDVGLTLSIRPQISEGGVIRMQVFQEASSIQPGTLSNLSGPITNKRAIETSVVVDDGGVIVIGGLIEDSFGAGEDKVPVLGDVPVVGNLFRYETRTRVKTNLMVFLRPQIVRDAAGYESVTNERYDYILGEQYRSGEDARLMRGEEPVPMLPPRLLERAVPATDSGVVNERLLQ